MLLKLNTYNERYEVVENKVVRIVFNRSSSSNCAVFSLKLWIALTKIVDNVKAEDGGGEEGGAVCLHLLLPHISECDGGAVNGVMNPKYDI